MPLRKPHSTETEYVHRMTDGHRQVLETTILAPAIMEDNKQARTIHYGLWIQKTPQIRLKWNTGERQALEWLAEQLEDWHWREHDGQVDVDLRSLQTFQERAEKLAKDIRFELSDARQDTLADPREAVS